MSGEPVTTVRPPQKRRGATILILAAVLFAALWSGYWYATNRMITAALAEVSTDLAARGRALACGDEAVGGFPLKLTLDCGSPTYADGTAGVSAGLARISASAPLYWPGSVSTALAGPLTFKAPGLGIDLNASWTAASASAEAGLSGLTSAAATFDELSVANAGRRKALPVVSLAAAHAEAAARPAGGRDYTFTAEGDGIAIRPAAGAALPELDAVVRVKAIGFGDALGTDPARTLLAWLAGGGALEVERLTLAAGTTSATATGKLSVSQAGLVSGDLNLRLVGLGGLPDLFTGLKPKARNKLAQAVAAVSALTKPVADDPAARDAPLAIRNGVMMVGFIPVGEIPPLKIR